MHASSSARPPRRPVAAARPPAAQDPAHPTRRRGRRRRSWPQPTDTRRSAAPRDHLAPRTDDEARRPGSTREQGFAMVFLVLVLMPVVLIVGAFTVTMTSKGKRLMHELDEEKAFLAAEAAVDEGIYRSDAGTLVSGTPFSRNLGGGLSFDVLPTYLGSDGEDNDGDTVVDEPDEDVYRLEITGRYRQAVRRFAAYLGPVSWLPPLESAATVLNPAIDLQIGGTPLLSGFDRNMDGSAGSAANDKLGLTITAPGTLAQLISSLSPGEQAAVVGTGGSTPSLGVSAPIDTAALAVMVQNSANVVLTNGTYGALQFGNGETGTANIAFRNGDVKFSGNSRGAGILLVTGDLELSGNFRFDGVVIVLGQLRAATGNVDIRGGVVLGPASTLLSTSGTATLQYSAEAITLANSRSGRYVAFNGWQELAR